MQKFLPCCLTVTGRVYLLQFMLFILVNLRIRIVAGSLQEITYTIDKMDLDDVHHLALIVEALENMGILESSHKQCYNFEKIVKVSEQVTVNTLRISIDLHIQESLQNKQDSSTDSQDSGPSSDDQHTTDGCLHTSQHSENRSTLGILFLDDNSTQVDGGVYVDRNVISAARTDDSGVLEGGLSKTQILVISSCSTVIGLFFIVALIMRVRNYLKRIRADKISQQMAPRTRSSADGASLSTENRTQQKRVTYAMLHYPGFKPPRSHGYKLGSSLGFSLFHTHGDRGGTWN